MFSESVSGKYVDLLLEQYSSDGHLLQLLFGEGFGVQLEHYSRVKVVSDIHVLNEQSLGQGEALVVLCELERYSTEDLSLFLESIKKNSIPVFTASPANLHLINEGGLSASSNASLLNLRLSQPTAFHQHVQTAANRLTVDLHSSQLTLAQSLLLPHPPVPAVRPYVLQNSRMVSRGKKPSLVQRLRYPLAVTKRHLKNCIAELKALRNGSHDCHTERAPLVTRTVKTDHAGAPEVELSGVVFLATFDSFDFGSDWTQLVTAFCVAMRHRKNATLVLWVTGTVNAQCRADLHHMLCTITPFECSVALIQGELSTAELYSLFKKTRFLLNVEMYRNLRLDVVAAAACGIPVISAANSSVDTINQQLVFCSLETDEQLAAPDRSTSPAYTTRHFRVVWQDLCEQITGAYLLAENELAYKEAQLLQMTRFKKLSAETFADCNL